MKKLLQNNLFWLVIILILAAALRLWSLSTHPAGLNADEAALGYNAYSLLETGRDEYGTSWPLVFKSFGDYKPGLYVYFLLPFIKILGLNVLAVRLPSALLGIGTVYLIYLLVNKLFGRPRLGLLSAFLLAITPWHLQFSRGGWESNCATFFITLGIYLFIKDFHKRRYLLFSGLSFLVATYLYQSPRLIIPVLSIGLLVLYWKQLKLNLKKDWKWILLLIICAIPLALQFTSGQGSARFSGLSFLSDLGPTNRLNELRGEHTNPNSKATILVHNKVTSIVPQFLGHYLDHFRSDFLFINGDEVIRSKVPETGQFYLIESIFLLAGLLELVMLKNRSKALVGFWLLVSPLAASLTFQTPSALRSLTMVVPFTIIMTLGADLIIRQFKNWQKILVIAVIALSIGFEFTHYLESYYVIYPQRYPLAWEYGFDQMVPKLMSYQNQFKSVVITDRYDQPYILVLFYEKYNPAKYQPQAKLTERDKFNFGTVRGFDSYHFRSVDPKEIEKTRDTLFVVAPNEVPEKADIIDQVNFPNGQPAFVFIKT